MRENLDDSDGALADQIEAIFAIFYVDDSYIALRDAKFLQEALDLLVETFKRVGLATNTKKTQAMVCTPGNIRVQLPTDSYQRLREGIAAGEEGKRAVVCHVCKANLQARSLRLHLESAHNIYQQVVVADNRWRTAQASASRPSRWGERSRSSACSQGALGDSAAHICCAGTSGTCTQRTKLRLQVLRL